MANSDASEDRSQIAQPDIRFQKVKLLARRFDWLVTLGSVYLVNAICQSFFLVGKVTPFPQPFRWLPLRIFVTWDAAYYRHFFAVAYDRFLWPPLYPYSLRVVWWIFRFSEGGFERSAVILNLIAHGFIIWAISRYLRRDPSLAGVSPVVVTFLIFFFPGHNVFFAAYSESFYLAVTIAAFLLYQDKRLAAAALCAGVSALIRTMGSFLALAFFVDAIWSCWRQRRLDWRRLAGSSLGLVIVAAWNFWVKIGLGTTLVGQESDWVNELIEHHVPAGVNPRLWVLHYLAIGSPIDAIAFWTSFAGIIYCLVRRRWVEGLYISIFYASLAFYIYRPFAWTRYVSVLFPLQFMIAHGLRGRERWTLIVLVLCVVYTYSLQFALFQLGISEP